MNTWVFQTASTYQCTAGDFDASTSLMDIQGGEEEGGEENDSGEGENQSNHGYEDPREYPKDFKSVMASWILRIKECCKLTQATIEEVIDRVTDLNQYILSKVLLGVKAGLLWCLGG